MNQRRFLTTLSGEGFIRRGLKRLVLGGLLALMFPLAVFAQNFAYVLNQLSGTASVIATASNTVVATVAVGPTPFG
ncbi:MAG: hypothetical protein JO166_02940, partial [Deltaproteobacteria bacterium]|nr:hypothetical protein [Deltaproteobacteria bacterium]